jgi:hypothetical protein
MKVTKEIWTKIHAYFKEYPLYLDLQLLADGYKLTYQSVLNKQNKVQIMLYIDGTLSLSDYGHGTEIEDMPVHSISTEKGLKFGRKCSRKRYTDKDKSYLKMRYGKKEAAEKQKETYSFYVPIFFTTKQIQKILTTNCTDIQLHPDFIERFLKYY